MAKAASKHRSGWLLPEGEDCWDLTIKRLQVHLAEMTQIMVENRLMKSPLVDGEGLSRARFGVLRNPLREPRKKKRHESHVDLESQGDSEGVHHVELNLGWTFWRNSTPKETEKGIYGKGSTTEQPWHKSGPSFLLDQLQEQLCQCEGTLS